MPTYIIAAIDPGATTGIAILSLSGKKIATASTNGGMGDAVRIIERHGTPSLIACDVSPAPEAAQKIASYFSCRLFEPGRGVREEEKRQIAKGAGVENNHERDAYAAAVLAYRQHANKLRQIESLPDISREDKERVSHLMLKGYRLKDAFLELREPEKGQAKAVADEKASARPISAEDLKERVSSLARENANLRLMLSRIENEKGQLKERLRLLENGVRQSFLRDSELRKLRFQLQKSAEWLQRRKKVHGKLPQKKLQKAQQKSAGLPPGMDEVLNSGGHSLDLEKMVADYRKGRKQL